MNEVERLRWSVQMARSLRDSFPHGRVRVTPAMHQELAEDVVRGTDLIADGVIVESLSGVRIEIDADVPDPGWILETWK